MIARPGGDAVAVDLRAASESGTVGRDEPQAELLRGGGGRARQAARAGPVEDDDERAVRRAERRVGEAAPVGQLELGVVFGGGELGSGEDAGEGHGKAPVL